MYRIYYVHMLLLLNENYLKYNETMVIIVDITQVVHKGTIYLNKTLSVCQYNLEYSGNV